eukprot:INCI8181.1.p1 GENE.INCI8181.1~~INCI8181.1.p1  ORF type:complete len:274 (-),score=53.14 INCI8181.1:96-917(-)
MAVPDNRGDLAPSTQPHITSTHDLEVDGEARAHGTLDVEHLDVLPALLQQSDEEVDGKLQVDVDGGLVHGDVADGEGHAENLLELELDGTLDLVDLGGGVLTREHTGGELTGTGQRRAEKAGELLDERVGGEEGIVLAGELGLDDLLVLVELLKVIDGHEVKTHLLAHLSVSLVGKHADLEGRARVLGELEGAGETLVLGGIVVLEGDLELDRLEEVTLLALELNTALGDGLATSVGKDIRDGAGEDLGVDLRHGEVRLRKKKKRWVGKGGEV